MRKTCILLFLIFILFGCDRNDPNISDEFKQKVKNKSVTLLDWKNASNHEKTYFTEEYTRMYLSEVDYEKAEDLRTFLDGSVEKLTEKLQTTDASEDDVQRFLKESNLFDQAKAGAKMMGWPSPSDG